MNYIANDKHFLYYFERKSRGQHVITEPFPGFIGRKMLPSLLPRRLLLHSGQFDAKYTEIVFFSQKSIAKDSIIYP